MILDSTCEYFLSDFNTSPDSELPDFFVKFKHIFETYMKNITELPWWRSVLSESFSICQYFDFHKKTKLSRFSHNFSFVLDV